jgi:hypothetical protein
MLFFLREMFSVSLLFLASPKDGQFHKRVLHVALLLLFCLKDTASEHFCRSQCSITTFLLLLFFINFTSHLDPRLPWLPRAVAGTSEDAARGCPRLVRRPRRPSACFPARAALLRGRRRPFLPGHP